jgi:hypothetical protein
MRHEDILSTHDEFIVACMWPADPSSICFQWSCQDFPSMNTTPGMLIWNETEVENHTPQTIIKNAIDASNYDVKLQYK